jgi:hypothetical protein
VQGFHERKSMFRAILPDEQCQIRVPTSSRKNLSCVVPQLCGQDSLTLELNLPVAYHCHHFLLVNIFRPNRIMSDINLMGCTVRHVSLRRKTDTP